MDSAPLNLAHFHERRADKLIKRHRYEEAFKAVETSLLYVEDAYKHVKIPKSVDVLNTQKWEYERKLNQIQMRKLQYEKMKLKEIVPSSHNEGTPNNTRTDIINSRSVDNTIKEFNDKYGSNLPENIKNETEVKENIISENTNEYLPNGSNESSKVILTKHLEMNIKRLSLVGSNLLPADDDVPSLAPLELPSFDYIFEMTSGLENLQK